MPISRSPEKTPSAARVMYDDSSQQPGKSSGMASTPAAEEVHIGAASTVRLLPFWRENPLLWFAQVESVFVIHKITNDETKFRYVILYLNSGVLPLVADIVTSPPDGERYVAIKERLTTVLSEISATRLRRLLASHELGDDKPSVLSSPWHIQKCKAIRRS